MKSWFKKLLRRLFRKKYHYARSDDIPDYLENDLVYICDENQAWAIIFVCPCGCGEPIYLNLLQSANPKWKYSIKRNKISIFPSIDRIRGCKSHFWLRNGKIYWCDN